MEALSRIVAYWTDCIKSESAQEQSFGLFGSTFRLHNRIRVRLFDGTFDPFIFGQHLAPYKVAPGSMHSLVTKALIKSQDICFGYPLLRFYDRQLKQYRAAPLFIMRLKAANDAGALVLSRADPVPSVGALALERLGLSPETITALSNDLSDLFNRRSPDLQLDSVWRLVKREANLVFAENLNPRQLSSAGDFRPDEGTAVYNKALLYVSESSSYNLHLLRDLEQLAVREDLSRTALSYLVRRNRKHRRHSVPVLPFEFDECQLDALQAILGSRHTVVTGPPGTGKSQFIANLIVNLFLKNKRVLFVSHTGEAVRVVNERVNGQFMHLMSATGNKSVRQDLGRRLNELVALMNGRSLQRVASVWLRHRLNSNWRAIRRRGRGLKRSNLLLQITELALARRPGTAPDLICRGGAWLLDHRKPDAARLDEIDKLKIRHVELSRDYVSRVYLARLLAAGRYGTSAAYLTAIQQQKFVAGRRSVNLDKYGRGALSSLPVWSCTLKSLAATFPLQPQLFDYVIFDEASQIDLPAAAPALYRARRSVVVGDENQLSHIARINAAVEDALAEKYRLRVLSGYPALTRYTDVSLFLSAKRSLDGPEQELKNHYRSNTLIARLFSTIFYDGKLNIYEPEPTLPRELKAGYYWIDVKGVCHKHRSGSRYNPLEAQATADLVGRLSAMTSSSIVTIGVATPYARQRDELVERISAAVPPDRLANIRVLSVHQFQGSEVDVLIFSPVLAAKGDGNSEYWYMTNRQLLNVAISRAKQLLLIVGDKDFALQGESKLREIARCCSFEMPLGGSVPGRPMSIFEQHLLSFLKSVTPRRFSIEPQYVVDNRFTVDFALISKRKKLVVQLDGRQHEIIGGLPVLADRQRDRWLESNGWQLIRIKVHELLRRPEAVKSLIQQSL